MTSVGGGAALHYMMPMHEHEPDFPPDPSEPLAPEADGEGTQEEVVDNASKQLNLSYSVKPPKPRPGGYAERLEKMRAAAKLSMALHIENKPTVFGSRQPRIEVFPGSTSLTEWRPPGLSDWGNGKIVGTAHYNPLWGKKEDFPDDLDIAGHYKAAEPGETVKERLYLDVKQPNKAGLWSRTVEPRMAPSPKPAAQPHIAKGVDPYNVVYKEKHWKERGTIRSQPEFKSAPFADTGGRVDIKHQIGPHMSFVRRPSTAGGAMQSTAARKFHGNASTGTLTTSTGRGQTTKPLRSSLEVWQETMERISLQHNSKTFLEHGKPNGKIHDQERFGKIVGIDTLLATAKSNVPEAPPPTKYDTTHPLRPTIATSARKVQSARPGYRGGLFRQSTAGSYNFISSAERMQIPAWKTATSEQKGLCPQSHADGLLRDTISGRAQSARQARKKNVEKPAVDQPVLTGKTRKRRTQSARAAYRDVWQDSLTANREAAAAPKLMSPMITQELLRNWAQVLQ